MTTPPDGRELVTRTTAGVFLAVVTLLAGSVTVTTVGVDTGVTGPQSPFGGVPLAASAVAAGVLGLFTA